MKGLDLSFACPPLDWWQRRRSDGFEVVFQCLWTGGFAGNDGIKAAAETNLRNARMTGFRTVGGYVNASPPTWWPLDVQMREIRANAGGEWTILKRVAVDLEIPGLTLARAEELADALRREGKNVEIVDIGYTARWFWVGHMGNSLDPRWLRFKLWNANYDWNPDVDFGAAPYGPWKMTDLVGEQYQGTTQLDGYAVDLNTFIDSAFAPSVPTPVPTPEEVLMGKIADDFAALGRTVEAEVEAAKALPAPIPGPVGPTGPAGPAGGTVPAPSGARYDTLLAADGHFTGFCARNGITVEQGKALNPNGPPSGNWNIVHAGEVYRVA